MNKDRFWSIVDRVHRESGGDMERKCELLKGQFAELSAEELQSFNDHFAQADADAYTWELWGAAYVINGGCGDDTFSDFRATLISWGRETYEAAVRSPESLADLEVDSEDLFFEGYQYVWQDVAETTPVEFGTRGVDSRDEPSGEEWDEDDDIDRLYPRLAAKYWGTAVQSDAEDSDLPAETRARPGKRKPWWKFW